MNKIILSLLTICILLSCNNNDDNDVNKININAENHLIFGRFNGECIGEGCVETFKLTNTLLFEDTVDDYNGVTMEFIELENDIYEQVKDLIDYFPNEILNQDETIFGCPDCGDQGGLLIQYSENGNLKSWKIDQYKDNVPDYLHSFIDEVNNKIALINN